MVRGDWGLVDELISLGLTGAHVPNLFLKLRRQMKMPLDKDPLCDRVVRRASADRPAVFSAPEFEEPTFRINAANENFAQLCDAI